MFKKKLIRILLCVLMITGGVTFSRNIVKAIGTTSTGWKQSGTTWYYLNSSGTKTVGWIQSGGKWYYLNSNGAMATGWIQSGGKWYYLNSSGAMATNWIQDGGTWYYLNSSGEMAIGWIQLGGKWYYLYSSGGMAFNTKINIYYLGSDGAMQDNNTTSVSLNKTTATLIVAGTDTLIATISPKTATNEAFIWTSSNNSIASVDNTGKVTAVSAGKAAIKVTTADGSKAASCSVVVINPVTAISLNKTTNALSVNGIETLVATVTPDSATNKTVIWTSSNNYIVTVDNTGKITAVNPGIATIAATTEDGSKNASCIVTVTLAQVGKVVAINLNKVTDNLIVGGTDTLIANVIPDTATNKIIIWSSSNNAIAAVDNAGKVIALSVGSAIITGIAADGGYIATCNVIVRSRGSITFAIDIGHNSQYDTGAVGIRSEDVANKEVGTRVMEKLIKLGYGVIDTSPTNATSTTNSLQQRCDIANAAKADYYVAIHFNIFNGLVSGSEVYVAPDGIKTKAQQVLNNIASLGYKNRGVKEYPWYVLKYTDMPAMLIECAFLDSASDMAMYNPDAIAEAIVNGLIAGN